MTSMYDFRAVLPGLNNFVDNEHLQSYIRLVERNRVTPQLGGRTNAHHVIPRSWFKINNYEIDNSQNNLVNLVYRDHVLAHYYLCLCTNGDLLFANELALVCLTGRKKLNAVDKQLVTRLPLYNKIYEDYIEKCRSGYKLYEEKQ